MKNQLTHEASAFITFRNYKFQDRRSHGYRWVDIKHLRIPTEPGEAQEPAVSVARVVMGTLMARVSRRVGAGLHDSSRDGVARKDGNALVSRVLPAPPGRRRRPGGAWCVGLQGQTRQ
ncbi:hypothetical protein [Streptomyces sp. GSL17-111]|uniref:hypothetical protein n=1 Tax=Streptomyces sp. GSL17-111 TaxID=3121596 RepID=UPI0030F3A494